MLQTAEQIAYDHLMHALQQLQQIMEERIELQHQLKAEQRRNA